MAEGDGRYGDRESLQFFVVARGSAREAAYWIARASDRNLIPQNMRTSLEQELEHATKSLNALISYRRNRKVGAVQEEISEYSAT
jgi:four helix bundle protein